MGALEEEYVDPDLLFITRTVRKDWEERLKNGIRKNPQFEQQLAEGFPELEDWAVPSVARRYLGAMNGKKEEAAKVLAKAIECRLRDRKLFSSLLCKVTCDARVIGRDSLGRPAVYVCAGNQQASLKDTIPQIFCAFEAAVRMTSNPADGQVFLICDMHKLNAGLNMDNKALKYFSENFGSVFADRLCQILIVDFNWVAQMVWALLKPLLSERTQNKISFVNENKARKIIEGKFDDATAQRIFSSFDINRDTKSSELDRTQHARRTSICDVPLRVGLGDGELALKDEAAGA